jgi:hypothetical protein
MASRSECAYKLLDSERRIIDDLIQVRYMISKCDPDLSINMVH